MFLLREEIPMCTVTLTTFMPCRVPPGTVQALEKLLEFVPLEGRVLCQRHGCSAQKGLKVGLVQPRKQRELVQEATAGQGLG